MARLAGISWWILGLLAQAVAPARVQAQISFRDVTAETGIAFCHTDGSSGRHYIVETVASGLATFDANGDGRIDIYFLNGRSLPSKPIDDPARNAFYWNRGGLRFSDATRTSGTGDAGYGLGVAVGDYDNDGWPDLYVSNFGPNLLYHNNGDGTFTDVTARAGVARGPKVGAGVNFLDYDGDGLLDLFAADYIGFSYANHVTSIVRGGPRYAGPRDFPMQPNHLFHNRGDGTFADVSAQCGIAAHRGSGMGTVCLDSDEDGRTDIFVCNDQHWNFLFRNAGQGKFEEVAMAAGVGCNYAGEIVSGMGADAGDFDHDGRIDLFLTDYEMEKPILLKNLGRGMFEDVTPQTGVAAGALAYVKWGCGLADFDNDGHPDIFIGCGHLQDAVEQFTDRIAYAVPPVLLRNNGKGRFVNVSQSSGEGLRTRLVARGLAVDDLDNDGRVDIAILNSRRPPTILRNDSPGNNHWLQIQVRGVKTNRDGIGARVQVTAGGYTQTTEVHSGRGYQSHFGSRLHFGLGPHDRVDRIAVRWIGGGVEIIENLPADQRLAVVEGEGL